VVGLTRPERLAEGAAIGSPRARISASAAGCEGQRTATVFRPPVTAAGTAAVFSRTKVRGPGQKAFMSLRASGETRLTTRASMAGPSTWTIRGLSEGRPFAL
jgi:hypothetical protein